jgi:hypothetical protein
MGNEVNSHWWWANTGRITMEEFADDYLRTVRLAHTAIRKESSWARVYVSLEHHWNSATPRVTNSRRFRGGRSWITSPGGPGGRRFRLAHRVSSLSGESFRAAFLE